MLVQRSNPNPNRWASVLSPAAQMSGRASVFLGERALQHKNKRKGEGGAGSKVEGRKKITNRSVKAPVELLEHQPL